MEYVSEQGSTAQQCKVLCCECGVSIDPNPSNMCVACLRTTVDITEGIPKQGTIYFCRGCERYLQPPAQWVHATLESRELLGLCLKKIKGLNRVRLVDAAFVWTEPHSRRIKVKLTVQKEVAGGTILQQVFVIEFMVNHQMCDKCHRFEAKDFWRALVQVRQKVQHKKTFFYLEQLILKHDAHRDCLNIKATHEGLDFYFSKKDEARKMVDFFQSVVPCKYITSQQLISHDIHSNVFNYKHTFSVEIAPVCKDDIVCLPPTLARSLGSMSQICICLRVTSIIHLIDPTTLQVAELTSLHFWRQPFRGLCTPKQLTEYVVMDIAFVKDSERVFFSGQGKMSQRHVLADAWVIRACELGMHENYIHTRTHLGHILKPGDSAMGFDLANANVNDPHFEKLKPGKIPEVVLVKKVYGDHMSRCQRRRWKLKRLQVDMETETSSIARDYTAFLEELEEDPAFRQNVNIYKDHDKVAVDTDDDDGDAPRITLQEMMDDLAIEDDPMGDGEPLESE
ncbi:60S ribosomal export protein NMD3-like [Ornithodoros turicata]|uniref:60S ribosomal export protein NMD3 n=1 Tax=Ornithodoros turicata TaxID=34597 RepID=A0A2R5LN22_9ACAR